MLSKGWSGIFSEAAHNLAFETLEHAIRADHIDSDRCLIKSIYYNLFSGEGSNKNHSYGGNDSNLLIVFYVQIMPDDLVMQLHRF